MKKLLLFLIPVLLTFQGYTATIDWKGVTWTIIYGTAVVNGSDELILTADASGNAWVHVNQIPALAGASTPWLELTYMDDNIAGHNIDLLMEDEGGLYPRFACGSLWSKGEVMAMRRQTLPTYETYLFWDGTRQNIERSVYVGKRSTGTLDVDFDGIKRSSTYLNQTVGGSWEYADIYLRLRGAASGETVTFKDFTYGTNHVNQNPTAFLVTFDDQGTAMSIKTAVDETANGDMVNILSGTYTEGSMITVDQSISIIGSTSPSRPVINTAGTTQGSHLFYVTAAGVSIYNLDITKTNIADQNIIYVGGDGFVLDNCKVHGQYTYDDGTVCRAMVVQAGGFSGMQISNNEFYNLRQPAYISGTHTGNITNNLTYGTKGWVLEGGNLTFTGNTWGTGAQANVFDIAILALCPATYYTDIVAMSNANNNAVIEDQRVSPRVLSVVYVDKNSTQPEEQGSLLLPYKSVTPAITRVVAGGKIYIADGTYTESAQLLINKNINMIGEAKATTIIKPGYNTGSGGDARGFFLVQTGFTFNLSEVTIDGTGQLVSIGILSHGPGTISNCILKNIGYNPSGPDYAGRGIAFYNVNMTISGNELSNIGRIGLYMYGAGVTNGIITGNTYYGKGTGNWLDYAIEVEGGAHATITGNTVKYCKGIASVDGSGSAGFLATTYFAPGTQAYLENNIFEDNSVALAVGYSSTDGTSVTAFHNKFLGTGTENGVQSTAPAVNAEENYWGTVTGLEVAAKTEGNVDYTPWCNSDFTICSYGEPGGPAPITTIGTLTDLCPTIDPINLPVTVSGYNDVSGVSLVFDYPTSFFDIYTIIPNGSLTSFLYTDDNVAGRVYISATNLPGLSLPDNATLFTIRLKYVGTSCNYTGAFTWNNSDVSFLEYSAVDGSAYIDDPFGSYYINGSVKILDLTPPDWTAPIFRRDMPLANVNNSPNRSNVTWADGTLSTEYYGDDFTLGPSSDGFWTINKVVVWGTAGEVNDPDFDLQDYFNSISLYGADASSLALPWDAPHDYSGTPEGTLPMNTISTGTFGAGNTVTTADGTIITVVEVNYYNGESYLGSSGIFRRIWKVTFDNLNWTVPAQKVIAYGVNCDHKFTDVPKRWYNHYSNIVDGAAPYTSYDGLMLDFAPATPAPNRDIWDVDATPYWGKTNDHNVLIYGIASCAIAYNGCLSEAPTGPTATQIAALFTDNCGGPVTATKSSVITGNDCDWNVKYIYEVVDACGNMKLPKPTVNYHGYNQDSPVLATTPPTSGGTVECESAPTPPATLPIVQNACGTTLSPTWDSPVISPLNSITRVEDFTSGILTSATAAPGKWYVDRYAPAGFTTVDNLFGTGKILKHSINATDGLSGRPGAYQYPFYNTQGRKYNVGVNHVEIKLYIPADWATTNKRMAGFWGTAIDADYVVSGYPIIEFTSDNSNPRFRAYENGTWFDLGLPTGFAYDSWVTLQITLQGDKEFKMEAGDKSHTTTTMSVYNSNRLNNVILQGHNYDPVNTNLGVTYDIYWDDFNGVMCEGMVYFIYRYEDCNDPNDDEDPFNQFNWTYSYAVDHTTAPAEVGGPVEFAKTVECAASATAPTVLPVVKDVCGIVLDPVGPVTGGTYTTCEGSKTYTYTYTDCAGLTYNWVYTYTIDHTIEPVVPPNAGKTVSCPGDAVAPILLTDVVDQQQTLSFAPWTDQVSIGQSFTCSMSGLLTKIDVEVGTITGTQNFTLKIFLGNGIAGDLLYSGSASLSGTGWKSLTIPQNLAPYLTAGTQYTFWLESFVFNSLGLRCITPSNYPGGVAMDACDRTLVFEGVTYPPYEWAAWPNYDLVFKTYMTVVPVVTDVCGTVIPTPTPVITDVPDPLECEGTRTYTYTYTDCSGLSTDWLYTYNVNYTGGLTPPANVTATVSCPSDAVDPGAPAAIIDACGRTVTPVRVTPDPPVPVCNGTVVWTYRYTACDGTTTADWTKTYTVTYSGGLANVPASTVETVSCPANATDPGNPGPILDACGRTVNAVLIGKEESPNPVTCNGTIIWRYRYTACDGTTADWTKTYTVTYSGGLANVPGNTVQTVSCPADATDPGNPGSILDACGRTVTAVLIGKEESPNPVTCNGTIIWRYRYSACDGSTADWTKTYTVTYSGGLANVPGNATQTVSCPADAVNPGNPGSITDACGRTVNAVLVGSVDNPNPVTCEGTRVWTYRYTACDGVTSADWTYTYTIDHTTAPVVTSSPAPVNVECESAAIAPAPPTGVVDVCGNAITPTGPVVGGTVSSLYVTDFSTVVVTGPTEAPGIWYTDRYAPAGFTSPVSFGGNNRLMHSINVADGANNRPSGYSSAFYNTQGRAYNLMANTNYVEIELYIPADWAGTARRMAGLWGVAVDAGNAVSGYPIVEFTSNTEGSSTGPRFRAWESGTGAWVDMAAVTTFDVWVKLSIELLPSGEFLLKAGENSYTTNTSAPDASLRLKSIILQGHNTTEGVTYDIYWDNLSYQICEGTKTFTWTYEDCSGLSTDYVYTYNIDHTTPPVQVGGPVPVTTTVSCPGNVAAPTVLPVVADVCGVTLPAPAPVVSAIPACSGNVTYTYTYVDCADLEYVWVYTYTISAPVVTMPGPGSATVDCPSGAVEPTPPVVNDNCGRPLTISAGVPSTTPACSGTRTWTYTYTDCAGATYNWVFTYTISNPVVSMPAPGGSTVDCPADAVEPVPPNVYDNCGRLLTVSAGVPSATPSCDGSKTWTFMYSDCSPIEYTYTWVYTYTITKGSLSGTLKYYNTPKTPMNNVTITLQPGGASDVTEADGSYSIPDLCPGTYTVSFATNKPIGYINSTDAALVNYWGANESPIEHVKWMAGDVTYDYGIQATDASAIQNYFVHPGNPEWAFSRTTSIDEWTFWGSGNLVTNNSTVYPEIMYDNFTVDVCGHETVNIYGMGVGDFNGSFTPGNTKAASTTLDLVYNETKWADAGAEVSLPVSVKNSSIIGAVSLVLNFPSELAEVTNVTMEGNNGQFDWSVNGNALLIGWNTLQPLWFEAGADLLKIELKTSATFGQGDAIRFELAANPANELADGSFNVIPDAVIGIDLLEFSTYGIDEPGNGSGLILETRPNPFATYTTLSYNLPADGSVTLEVSDMLGRKVTMLIDEYQLSGKYNIKLDAIPLQPGVYTAKLTLHNGNGDLVRTIKLVRQQ